jgi:carbonic anhydrase
MYTHGRVSRRTFLHLSASAAALASAGLPLYAAADKPADKRDADSVLARLAAGNQRFVKGKLEHPQRTPEDFAKLAEGQAPVAVIVGCADSRVPPEIIFDQGVGDLFVVRVAGNVVGGAGPLVKGSIEYGVGELGAELIVVLGHSQCGAVKAAIQHIEAKDKLPGMIGDLVATIQPAVAAVKGKPGNMLENAIKANVERGVQRLTELSPILTGRIKEGKLKVVGAVYDLKTGKVTVG